MSAQEDVPCLHSLADGSLLLRLQVQPRAAANGIAGLQGEALKLRLTTPPVEGKANQAVLAYLAKVLHLPKSAFTLKSGQQSRSKAVVIRDAQEERVRTLLAGLIAAAKG